MTTRFYTGAVRAPQGLAIADQAAGHGDRVADLLDRRREIGMKSSIHRVRRQKPETDGRQDLPLCRTKFRSPATRFARESFFVRCWRLVSKRSRAYVSGSRPSSSCRDSVSACERRSALVEMAEALEPT